MKSSDVFLYAFGLSACRGRCCPARPPAAACRCFPLCHLDAEWQLLFKLLLVRERLPVLSAERINMNPTNHRQSVCLSPLLNWSCFSNRVKEQETLFWKAYRYSFLWFNFHEHIQLICFWEVNMSEYFIYTSLIWKETPSSDHGYMRTADSASVNGDSLNKYQYMKPVGAHSLSLSHENITFY